MVYGLLLQGCLVLFLLFLVVASVWFLQLAPSVVSRHQLFVAQWVRLLHGSLLFLVRCHPGPVL
jgi:hypothetical protein